ncbi:MAG TPA: hypothetical protein VFD30_03685 [Terriglobia bacterium]|jgi:hypothetical protein|nr:hypothetical protein [Terriglobia bacterium]
MEKTERDILREFRESGFEVVPDPARPSSISVKKYGCVRFLERTPQGTWTPSSPPYFVVHGLNCELEDRGYQKFWYSDGRRFPIRLNDLRTLHRFDAEVREILGLQSLYHESLGSTCARSVYDRLTGRPDSSGNPAAGRFPSA